MSVRLAVLVLWLIHFLPFRVIVWLGSNLGLLLHKVGKERRQVASINLKMCFPEMSENFVPVGR